ncbi:MAG: hypothetical protein RQ757_09220 [Pseudomonadales bacterium]|nr:hypothetical protein [Pseudomonadales bacterium]
MKISKTVLCIWLGIAPSAMSQTVDDISRYEFEYTAVKQVGRENFWERENQEDTGLLLSMNVGLNVGAPYLLNYILTNVSNHIIYIWTPGKEQISYGFSLVQGSAALSQRETELRTPRLHRPGFDEYRLDFTQSILEPGESLRWEFYVKDLMDEPSTYESRQEWSRTRIGLSFQIKYSVSDVESESISTIARITWWNE